MKKNSLLFFIAIIIILSSCAGPKHLSMYSKVEYKNNSSVVEVHEPYMIKQPSKFYLILGIPIIAAGVYYGIKSGINYGGLVGGASGLLVYDLGILMQRGRLSSAKVTPNYYKTGLYLKDKGGWMYDKMILLGETNENGEKIYHYIFNSAENSFLFQTPDDVFIFKKAFPNSEAEFPVQMLYESMKLSNGAFMHRQFTDRVRAVNLVYPNHKWLNDVNSQYRIMIKNEAIGAAGAIAIVSVLGRNLSNGYSTGSSSNTSDFLNCRIIADPICEECKCYNYTCHSTGKIVRVKLIDCNTTRYEIGAGNDIRIAIGYSQMEKIANEMTDCNCKY